MGVTSRSLPLVRSVEQQLQAFGFEFLKIAVLVGKIPSGICSRNERRIFAGQSGTIFLLVQFRLLEFDPPFLSPG